MTDILSWISLVVVGVVAGVANTVAGGGSLVTVPALVLLGFSPLVANATSRPAVLAQNVVALFGFLRGGVLREPGALRSAVTHALWAVPMAVLGAHVAAHWTSDTVFKRLLAGVLLVVLVLTVRRRGLHAERRSCSAAWQAPLFMAIGFYSGFIQAGVGFIVMAGLMATTGWSMKRINAEKVLVIGACTAVAVAEFLRAGMVAWTPAAALIVGHAVGGYLGARLTLRLAEATLLRAYATLLFVFAAALVLSGI